MQEISSLYIHFPYCKKKCSYCDFYKQTDFSPQAFHDYLQKSFLTQAIFLEQHSYFINELQTLYIGGGTPSLWKESVFLIELLIKNQIKLADTEFTVEVNPESFDEFELRRWISLGVNRFSVGLQSLNPVLLQRLGRIHSLSDSFRVLELLNGMNFSLDLMLGLPCSQELKRDIVSELEQLLPYRPEHVSLYILTPKTNYPDRHLLPNDEWIAAEYLRAAEWLKDKGYLHYEVSNFAKPKRESLHNLKYWHSQSVAALGPSASGFLAEKRLRYCWKIDGSIDFELEKLTGEQLRLERFYMLFRTNVGIFPQDFFSDLALERFKFLAQDWEIRGLAENVDSRFRATTQGFLQLDFLMDELFKEGII